MLSTSWFFLSEMVCSTWYGFFNIHIGNICSLDNCWFQVMLALYSPRQHPVVAKSKLSLVTNPEDKNQTEEKAKVVAVGWETYLNAA